MVFLLGFAVVVASVIGGYLGVGGHLDVLWQPFEFVIIFGGGVGAFVISNPKEVIIDSLKAFGGPLLKGAKYNKESYLELLGLLYSLFRLAKTKGDLALESHVENPEESSLIQNFPLFAKDHHAVEFVCDYLRLLTLGTSNSHEVEAIMDAELEVHHEEKHAVSGAILTMADAFPALGIVAAVLGVIHTMGSITEPPEVLGHLIGGALVGTFAGILLSYGLFGPVGHALEKTFTEESHYLACIKAGIIAHMQGYAPQVSIEFSRKTLNSNVRPTFMETEEMVQGLATNQ
ncbi:MAG: flagellar motor stator protein MotA [Rhodospirillales bacterium]|nr:flagellar motor stator protein MotA [Rhodospirillales bacterium]